MISLRSLRNIATLFSVVLAVAGLVSSFNYASTAEKQILGTLDALSPELLIIKYHSVNIAHVSLLKDIEVLQQEYGAQVSVVPLVSERLFLTDLQRKRLYITHVQTTPESYDLFRMHIAPKPQPSIGNEERHKKTCLVAKSIFPHLTASQWPVGLNIYAAGESWLIDGVFSSDERLVGIDWDRTLITPFYRHGLTSSDATVRLILHITSGVNAQALETVTSALMHTRNVKDFTLIHFQDMLEKKKRMAKAIRMLTESVSLVILLMASIGCMNIFFITVSERTREIGLRRALGATNGEIIFLVMKDCYLFMGIGTVLGLLLGQIFTHYLLAPMLLVLPEFSNADFNIQLSAIGKTIFFLLASATISGMFPAIRASRIEPAVALRE